MPVFTLSDRHTPMCTDPDTIAKNLVYWHRCQQAIWDDKERPAINALLNAFGDYGDVPYQNLPEQLLIYAPWLNLETAIQAVSDYLAIPE